MTKIATNVVRRAYIAYALIETLVPKPISKAFLIKSLQAMAATNDKAPTIKVLLVENTSLYPSLFRPIFILFYCLITKIHKFYKIDFLCSVRRIIEMGENFNEFNTLWNISFGNKETISKKEATNFFSIHLKSFSKEVRNNAIKDINSFPEEEVDKIVLKFLYSMTKSDDKLYTEVNRWKTSVETFTGILDN